MTSLRRREAPLVNRLWVLLFVGGMLAFAACATGAADCAIAKPAGLALVLGAAALSFLDPMGDRRELAEPVEVEAER
jgi:hypothetical protein